MIAIFGHRGNKNAYPRSIFAIIHPLEPEQNPRDSLIRDYIFFIFHQIIPCILTTWPSPLPNKTNLLCTNFVQRISLFFVESYFEQNFTQNYFSLHKFRTTNFLIFFLFNNERFIFTRLLFFVNFRTSNVRCVHSRTEQRPPLETTNALSTTSSVEKIRTDRERWSRHDSFFRLILVSRRRIRMTRVTQGIILSIYSTRECTKSTHRRRTCSLDDPTTTDRSNVYIRRYKCNTIQWRTNEYNTNAYINIIV